ncbi:MAG: EF-hand domain-containing protein [Promethearchaeota archaeon]
MLFEIENEELHKIREQFAFFDEDRSGSITINELGNIYKALGHNFTEKELLEMMNDSDLNQDGYITFHEFLSMYKKHVYIKIQEEKLMEAFRICDSDGSKYVTIDELKRIMREVGENLKDKQIRSMLKEVDMDRDDKINFEEFIKLMKSII